VGRLATYNAGQTQVQFDSTGQLSAGGGTIKLNKDGMTVFHTGKISFLHHDNTELGAINYTTSGGDPSVMFSMTNSNKNAGLSLYTTQNSGASAGLIANHSSNYTGFILNTENKYARLFGVALLLENYGINLGGFTSDTPSPTGVLRFKERTDNNTSPNSTQVDIFARTVGGVQKLYAKFGNGVVRELATA